MKVLQINTVCGTGSTGRIAVDLYHALEKAGHDCFIAYGRGNAPKGINSYRISSDLDMHHHALMTRITDKTGFYSTSATKKLVKIIDEYAPDIIHMHNLHGYYINLEVLFNHLSKLNKPIVWTLHDCWAFTGHCAFFDYAGCDKWKTGCKKCPQKGNYPKSILLDNSAFNYANKLRLFTSVENMTITTPSKWLAGLVKESFLGKYEVKAIYNGIDLNVFKPTESSFREKYGLEGKHIVLGVANVWDRRKGLNDFIKLAAHLDDSVDDSFQIILLGLDEKQIKSLPKNILGLERTNSVKELAEIYTTADVYVNTSVEESMGLTTVEALACGTPVIVYNATAVPECVDESVGITVEKGNVTALHDAIIEIKNKNPFTKDACIKKAMTYNKEDKFAEYIDLYSKKLKVAKPIRILHILGGTFRHGGTEAFIMNYYRQIDRSSVQFDFIVHGFEKGVYDDEIQELGGKIYNVPIKSRDYFGNIKALREILSSGEYGIVHSHMDAMGMVVLKLAKKCGIPVRIAHSHNTCHQTNNKIQFTLHEYARKNITKYATHLLACSEAAGKWLFGESRTKGNNFQVVNNAIDFDHFKFDKNKRNQIRKQLNTQDNFVVGHIGRFSEQKNHMFLLDIFAELLKQKPTAKLALVGDGHLKCSIEEKIKELRISENVLLPGSRQDTGDLINAFDVFLLPSLFEGLPVVLTEAQANGLKCFISDSITKEVSLFDSIAFIPLNTPPTEWAKRILDSCNADNSTTRPVKREDFTKTGYDIKEAAKSLQEFYLEVSS